MTVHVQSRPGFRRGYIEVWPMTEGDVVVTFSPDGNSLPKKSPNCWPGSRTAMIW